MAADSERTGCQFTYISEMWPNHLRAKGMSLGVAMISFMNIIWLQSAPTAFATIQWKFYLALIIPSFFGGIIVWFFFPNTKDRPLEEVAAIFGDEGESSKTCRVARSDADKCVQMRLQYTNERLTSSPAKSRTIMVSVLRRNMLQYTLRRPARRSSRRCNETRESLIKPVQARSSTHFHNNSRSASTRFSKLMRLMS